MEPEPSRDDLGSAVKFSVGRRRAARERPADQRCRSGGGRSPIARALRRSLPPLLLQSCDHRPLGSDCLGPGRRLLLAGRELGRGSDRPFSMFDAIEDRLDAEVVFLGHRVELMGMAAGAVECQAEEGLADDADHVFHLFFARDGTLRGIGLGIAGPVPGAADEHARGDDAVAGHRLNDIAGELLLHEEIVGLVVVEASDDIVAVVPGTVARMVVFKPFALGVADDIEPVPPPAFAVVRRGEEIVDEAGPGGVRGIGHEGLDLFRARRQADEIDEQPPYEDGGIGGRGGLKTGMPEPVEHPGIDRAARPRIARSGRERLRLDRLERPPVAAGPLLGAEGEGIERLLSPGTPGVEPGPQECFFFRQQRLVWGHLVPLHPLPEEALSHARLKGGATLPPLRRGGGIDERQPSVGGGAAMAGEAARDQKRGDLAVEVDGGRRWLGSAAMQRQRDRDREQSQRQRPAAHGRSPCGAQDAREGVEGSRADSLLVSPGRNRASGTGHPTGHGEPRQTGFRFQGRSTVQPRQRASPSGDCPSSREPSTGKIEG